MDDSNEYIEGKPTIIKSNRGKTYVFIPRYPKKEPDGFWNEAYRALEYIGIFDDLK